MSESDNKPKKSWAEAWLRIVLGSLLCCAVLAATVIGCSWPGTSHSVRFNNYQTEREMGRLPPLPTLAGGLNNVRASWEMEDPGQDREDDYSIGEKEEKEVDALWERAAAAEKDGNLRLDRDLLKEYLKRTEIERHIWFEPANRQARRNSASDRLDALGALDRGANTAKVRAYLEARRAHDSDKPVPEEVNHPLELAQSDLTLKDNVAYLRAAELYRQENFAEAAKAFDVLARQYPHSEKREAALFMAAVATMKTSASYVPASGNSDYKKGVAPDSTTDDAGHAAAAAFEKLIKEYPGGVYRDEARGWLAYLMLRRHDRAAALAQYYRLLADKNENARIEAAFSLTLVRSSATEDEMTRVEKELANEPEAALAYAYHNIYNYSVDPGETYPPYDVEPIKDSKGEEDYQAEQRQRDSNEKEWSHARSITSRKELTRTLNFSKQLMANYPRLAVGGAFALRAAQASEELDDNVAAISFAQRALQSRLSGEDRAQALWTLGIAQQRKHQLGPARQSFNTLLREYPTSRLREGARRNLAMIAEDAGDIDRALEQYIALDYTSDVSYFVDTLMSTDQLAGFIARHPDSPKKNEFTYALGLRYLRLNRWEDARRTLAKVHTRPDPEGNPYSMGNNCTGDTTIHCSDPKQAIFDESDNPIITPQLVLRDVQTANDLEALERSVNLAVGDEAKAEALYQSASYQYQASSLLFYNSLASPGYWNVSLLASEGRYRVTNEAQLLFDSTQEHERLARALNIYLDVVDRFPQTRAARDSFYTAAVCHERLSNFNPYWRDIYQKGMHAGERMVTYADVKAAYPNYQLPRGTFGWQPVTRTVNGGPGWQAPPQPPRRLTKSARLKSFVNAVVDSVTSFWNETGRYWFTVVVILLGLGFTARVAARNRKLLRRRLGRHRITHAPQLVTYPWFKLFWIDPVEPSRHEQIKNFLGEKRHEFLELARDQRGRPVLVTNIGSHALLSGLLLALIWTIW